MTRIFCDPETVPSNLLPNYYTLIVDVLGNDLNNNCVILKKFIRILLKYNKVHAQEIIEKIYGLKTGNKASGSSVAKDLSLSQTRIYAIKKEAFYYLRRYKKYYTTSGKTQTLNERKQLFENIVKIMDTPELLSMTISEACDKTNSYSRIVGRLRLLGIHTVEDLLTANENEIGEYLRTRPICIASIKKILQNL